MKLKIGNFARIGQVTVQTLRHYDELDLLKPSEVDPLSGYRYYVLDQLPRLHRILALKDLGFSLEQIAPLLEDDLPPAQLRGMLQLKQDELRQQVTEGLDRLERLEARLRLIEREDQQPDYEVIVKPVGPLCVASVRGVIPSYWEEGPLWGDLFHRLEVAGLQSSGPYLSLYHSGEPEIDVEACAPLPSKEPVVKEVTVRTLPAVGKMASTVHQGAFTGLAGAFAAILKWIDANGYHIAGPDRALYLRLPQDGHSRQDPNAITEMQVPIQTE
jgi:DNA-binding transcriptional MerR regulator/effector-binding domain-containing protein